MNFAWALLTFLLNNICAFSVFLYCIWKSAGKNSRKILPGIRYVQYFKAVQIYKYTMDNVKILGSGIVTQSKFSIKNSKKKISCQLKKVPGPEICAPLRNT